MKSVSITRNGYLYYYRYFITLLDVNFTVSCHNKYNEYTSEAQTMTYPSPYFSIEQKYMVRQTYKNTLSASNYQCGNSFILTHSHN